MSAVCRNRRRIRRAARLFGAAEALRAAIGAARPPRERAAYDEVIHALRADLGKKAWSMTWNEGHAMTLHQAVAYALEADDAI